MFHSFGSVGNKFFLRTKSNQRQNTHLEILLTCRSFCHSCTKSFSCLAPKHWTFKRFSIQFWSVIEKVVKLFAQGKSALHTGKSFSEALILASTNPQYDKRLFIDLPVQYMKTTSSEHVVYINCFGCQNKNKNQFMYTTCSEFAVFMYWIGKSMTNLWSFACISWISGLILELLWPLHTLRTFALL